MDNKVFLISFNKCGTVTFHNFFIKNNISCAHWKGNNLFLAKQINNNMRFERDPLHKIDNFQAFCDLTYETSDVSVDVFDIFDYIYKHYPKSYYIFFDRPIDDWIKSRQNHGQYLQRTTKVFDCTEEEVKEYWKKQYAKHKKNVFSKLLDRSNFLYYNLYVDKPQKIVDFLPHLNLDVEKWEHANKTKR